MAGGTTIDESLAFGILGPTAVWVGGRAVELGSTKPKILLAALLLRPNEAQSADYLATALWAKTPPTDPRATLYTYVARLRKVLAQSAARVRARAGGYLIEVDRARVDLGSFGAAVDAGDAAARNRDLGGEVAALRTASALWRGDPLADVPSDLLQREVVPHLTEWRLQVVKRRIDLELRLDRHAELIAELRGLTARHPLHEGFWAQLITALFRSGRQAEALVAFDSVRGQLREELGSDPSEELSLLHRAVLLGELPSTPAEQVVASDQLVASTPATTWLAQDRLPSDTDYLAGRDQDVSALVDLLQPATRGSVPIVAVTGAPGIGKSALAVRAGHRLRTSYPDGQWYVDLGGVGHGRRDTGEILDELLRTAGVPAQEIPADEGERAGLLRARLPAGRSC